MLDIIIMSGRYASRWALDLKVYLIFAACSDGAARQAKEGSSKSPGDDRFAALHGDVHYPITLVEKPLSDKIPSA